MSTRIAAAILMATTFVHGYTVLDHDQFMTKNIDPIVLPGKYMSHMHSFFGSDSIANDMPTSAALQKGCYSGDNANDLSVYWIPTLYYANKDKYTEVKPYRFSTYYNNILYAEIPFPQNFYAVAGNAKATRQSDVAFNDNGMSWWCENDPAETTKDGAKFPTKTCSTHLQTILRFPDCVNVNDMSKNAYSSSSYENKNYCPTGMKRIPQLRFSVRYDLRKIIPGGWSGKAPLKLACGEIGEGYCFHGDFINGWFEDALKNMMTKASDKKDFVRVNGSHGNSAKKSSCKPKDADPSHGTSDYATSVHMMNGKRDLNAARESFVERRPPPIY
ncbi:hypothetical protein K469DRAFT_727376 [Zopfia rhizophila CBS 207.26]|uniref:DUF1996 domain-containing protein n=1 Tax=Zopfia rhizophila CBS 207.26 TaxID=1314779 RepID=A0A6A6E0I0_9PEZI|nr:hypothetical protein K469DRAFT_727376 [Zopfia rhizophila CBS 207.26]